MTNINKHFQTRVTSPVRIMFTLLLGFFIIATSPSLASDPIFTVENVEVDETAENAIAAREKAFEQAQIDAFTELSSRMLPDTDLATTELPPVNIISTLIKDFELMDEKLSDVRYVATYTFRFKDRDVRRYFAQKGSVVTDMSSQKLLVLPFLDANGRTALWSPGNVWMQAWNRVTNLSGVVPLEVPLGDIADVRDIGDSNAFSYNPTRLGSMLDRYGAGEAVIVVASPDEQLQAFTDSQAVAQGNIMIEIYRTDRGGPEMVNQVFVNADGAITRQQLYDRGVTMVRSTLQKNWKQKTAIAPSPQSVGSIQVVVPINTLNDWLNIQSQLSRLSTLNTVMLRALTPRQANVEITYKGDRDRLALALAKIGMEIEETTASDGSPINMLSNARSRQQYQPIRF
ncbi:MAG: DUF2066 domain-containing protein [Bdellovibrionales bacterium]